MNSVPKGSTPGPEPNATEAFIASGSSTTTAFEKSDPETLQDHASSVSSADEENYPEGGWEAWGVVMGSFAAMVSVCTRSAMDKVTSCDAITNNFLDRVSGYHEHNRSLPGILVYSSAVGVQGKRDCMDLLCVFFPFLLLWCPDWTVL